MNTSSIALFLFGVLSSTTSGIQVAHEACSRAVSIQEDVNNDYCMALCEELSSKDDSQLNDSIFTESCAIAHYKTENGRVSSDNACFNNLIYGYSQDSTNDSLVQDLFYATPALCQLACQQHVDCVQWSWASSLVSPSSERHRCLLKSQEMIYGALSQKIVDSNSEVDTAYCNAGMPVMCSSNAYNCLKCDDTKRCAWKSDLHISGWKSCAADIDQCDGSVDSEAADATSVYPLCGQYASINPTLTNDYCIDTCNELMAKAGQKELVKNKDFVSNCSKEHYTTSTGQAKPTGKCFNNLVIGYAETMSSLASMETAQGLYVETPAQCQMHCQHHPDCKAFVFVTELIASTGSHDVHKCLLKSERMVEKALRINVAVANATVLDTQYCNANMPYMCEMGGYDCLSCRDGDKSCAYNSTYHIGGPTHCALSNDICKDTH